MKWTQTLIPTLKENPQDAEVTSHRLMIRAGLIRKLTSGAYSYLPLGFKILKKVENIIREEMDSSGAIEVLLPAIHPLELWKKTGRDLALGEVLIKYKDRHGKVFALGPTHEEVVTKLAADEISSYRDLPKTIYQIQTKFRDETRPRFGVIRSCEFIMKDAYSFDADENGLEKSYKKMYDAYCRIFTRCGLDYIAVEADPGVMGGNISHEFMVPSPVGEDVIAACACGYAASVMVAECKPSKSRVRSKEGPGQLKELDTPGVSTVEKVSALLRVKPEQLIKTLIYKADNRPVALLVRGDHEASDTKFKNFLKCESLEMADNKGIEEATGGPLGFSGPVGLKVPIYADYSIEGMSDAVTGANKKDKHLMGVNLDRDFNVRNWLDARMVKDGDACPKCGKPIKLQRAIEIGHTFKLGTKYSRALGASYIDMEGKSHPMIMGCYGIGVNRIPAASIESRNDKEGIIWPASISPYEIVVLPLNMQDKGVRETGLKLYEDMLKKGMDVLIDDRDIRAGVKFKDADLIGFPIQVIVGEKSLKDKKVELKLRDGGNTGKTAKVNEASEKIKFLLDKIRRI